MEKNTNIKTNTTTETIEALLAANITNMKLSKKDFKNVDIDIENLSEIKSMVSFYYMLQGDRIRVSNQNSALERSQTNNVFLKFFKDQMKTTEENLAIFLDVWTNRHPVAKWLKSHTGIGPVIAAGLVARFDPTKTQTAGGFWAYAGMAEGLDKRSVKKKGVTCEHCPEAKVLAWKAASSFKMQCTRKNAYYGEMYLDKKAQYTIKNENGGFKANAEYELSIKNIGVDTEAYKAYSNGKLSAGHIDAMAMRYVAKMLMSHMFDVMYMYEYGVMPPHPFTIHVLNHAHIMAPKNLDVILPYLKSKFPDKDWVTMINEHYRCTLL